MINAVNVASQSVAVNSPVLFGATRIKTGCSVRHEQGSGRFVLLKPGIYRVSFNASLSAAAATTAILNITQDGEQIAGANITSGVDPTSIESVSVTTLLRVYCSDVSSVSITNIGTTEINVAQANFVIERVC